MPIRFVPHDPAWAGAYQAAATELTSALGPVALRIEHVGSTAIPGIAAKPVIDVLVVVDRYDPEDAYLGTLAGLGYSYGHRDESHVFLTGNRGDLAFHIHVVEAAGPDATSMVRFRDYLRAHPAEAERYVTLKRRLAAQHDLVDDYASAKSVYIREVLAKAIPSPARIRAFEPDDLAACVGITNLVHPNHPIDLEEARAGLRDAERLELTRYVADNGQGPISGWGQIAHEPWHFHPRKFEVRVEVEPSHRRQGIGSALFDRLLVDLQARRALVARASATEGDVESIAFLAHRGFREVWRNLLSRVDITAFDPGPFAGAAERVEAQGITIATLPEELARDADVLRKVYELNFGSIHDHLEVDVLTTPSFDQYWADELHGPLAMLDAWFLARDGDRIVGASTLQRLSGSTDAVETGYTAVHADYERRGIAMALKLRTVAYAAEHGIRSIQTDSNASNERMLGINRALGFEPLPARITYEREL